MKQLFFLAYGVLDSQFGISWLTVHVKLRKARVTKCFVMTKILAHYFCFRHDEKVLKQKDKKKTLLLKGPYFHKLCLAKQEENDLLKTLCLWKFTKLYPFSVLWALNFIISIEIRLCYCLLFCSYVIFVLLLFRVYLLKWYQRVFRATRTESSVA